jgi:hypothetical protein
MSSSAAAPLMMSVADRGRQLVAAREDNQAKGGLLIQCAQRDRTQRLGHLVQPIKDYRDVTAFEETQRTILAVLRCPEQGIVTRQPVGQPR